MNFTIDKCTVMHGLNNVHHNYAMVNQPRIATDKQHNLGITKTKDLKWQKQTEKSCKIAKKGLGYIACNFNYKA